MDANGMMKADFLSGKKAPPKSAMAATGVKFGKCGNNRESAAIKIATETKMNFGELKFDFMFFIF